MSETLSFFVPGIPAPGGSKRFVGIGKKTGRAILIDAAGQRNKDWRATVATVAAAAMAGKPLKTGALSVWFAFHVPRPRYHKNAKGILKLNAPTHPTARPDVLKLARSTEDALTGIVWADDSQTWELRATKAFADTGGCGCWVSIKGESETK